jgi:predicted Zn-dependent protease
VSACAKRRTLVYLILAAAFSGACATSGPIADIQPGEQPALDTTEAGLWMKMDQVEERIRTSGKVETDPLLDAYVRSIVCKLAPEQCQHIRVYVINQANFNASMAPNGAMTVWAGLILRAQNEAQLAYVLGHELAHYERRHSLKRWQDIRAQSSGLVFFQIATAAVGLGIIGDLATLGVLANIYSFTRDQEREADTLGFELMVRAGYAPDEAAKIWQLLMAERDASEEPERMILFSTHPSTAERSTTLAEEAAKIPNPPQFTGRDGFLSVTAQFRGRWLRDELRWRDYPRLEVLLDQKLAEGTNPGVVRFYRGELYRRRGEDGDEEKAAAEYEAALETQDTPLETYRSLGLTYWSMQRADEARKAFEAYLEEKPDAEDRAMVEAYLQQMQ